MQIAMKMAPIRIMRLILAATAHRLSDSRDPGPMFLRPPVGATLKSCYDNGNSRVIRRKLGRFGLSMAMPSISSVPVLTWIAASPVRAFGAFLGLHVAVWTALPALLYPNLPLDLIEALIYGREWQLGYDKLPPLPWWLVEIAYRIAGHDFAFYLLAQAAVLAAFGVVFMMA